MYKQCWSVQIYKMWKQKWINGDRCSTTVRSKMATWRGLLEWRLQGNKNSNDGGETRTVDVYKRQDIHNEWERERAKIIYSMYTVREREIEWERERRKRFEHNVWQQERDSFTHIQMWERERENNNYDHIVWISHHRREKNVGRSALYTHNNVRLVTLIIYFNIYTI